MEPRKMILIKFFAGQQWRHREQRTDLQTRAEEGKEGGVYGDSSMETHITTRDIANGNVLYH